MNQNSDSCNCYLQYLQHVTSTSYLLSILLNSNCTINLLFLFLIKLKHNHKHLSKSMLNPTAPEYNI